MEDLPLTMILRLILLFIICHSFFIVIIVKKRKQIIGDYEKLLALKDWYKKISDEANRSYIIKNVEKRGEELINHLNVLNFSLIEIQEQHKHLHEQQLKLQKSLIEEQKVLNEYFENYN